MAAAPPTGMEKTEMRTLLMKAAPDNPVNFAFGLGKEAAFALLKLEKMKPPKMCGKMLEDEFPDIKNMRWGSCTTPPEVEGLVRFVVNRPVSGMAKRLTKTLKGTGFKKVEIVLEDGTLVEGGADEDGEAPVGQDGPAPSPDGLPDLQHRLAGLMRQIPAMVAADPAAKEKLVGLAMAANAALKADPAAAVAAIDALAQALAGGGAANEAAAGEQDAAALQDSLRSLVGQLGALQDRPDRGALVRMAAAAQEKLKAKLLREAASLIEALRAALDGTAEPAGARPVLQTWTDSKEAVDQQLGALYDVLRKSGLPVFDEVAGEIESVLDGYRTGLTIALKNFEQARGAKPARDAALKAVADAKARLAGDSHVTAADSNPFGIKVTARATLGAALDRLSKELSVA